MIDLGKLTILALVLAILTIVGLLITVLEYRDCADALDARQCILTLTTGKDQ